MILGAMLMDISSWKSSLQAYGISICEICKKKQTAQVLVAGDNTALTFKSSRYLQPSLVHKGFALKKNWGSLGRFCM